MQRCFGKENTLYATYHDEEWGVPVHDDRLLFEMLCLEGAQAGLSWEIVLKRREHYKALFHNFNPGKVAAMTDEELEELCTNPQIIRHKGKIFSVRQNARVFLTLQQEFGSFSHYVWGFVNHTPLINYPQNLKELPSQTEQSKALSKDLQKRGMTFVGPSIVYAFMQAVGLVNDHLTCCCKKAVLQP